MNIFVLAYQPGDAAHMHCDKHVVKMILETAQLLSTAHRVLDDVPSDSPLYKKTHENHPCAKWVRESSGNYYWAWNLLDYLHRVYTKRYNGKQHLTWTKLGAILAQAPVNIKQRATVTPFALAMPKEYIHPGCDVLSYRNYYIGAKAEIAKWKDGSTPKWWTVNQ